MLYRIKKITDIDRKRFSRLIKQFLPLKTKDCAEIINHISKVIPAANDLEIELYNDIIYTLSK